MTATFELENESIGKSKGGLVFELVLEKATTEAPAKPTQTRQLSVTDIETKLKAAEERRKSLEEKKLTQLKEKEAQLVQLRTKKEQFELTFKDTVRQTLERKMIAFGQNRDNLIRSVKDKLRKHESHVSEVRQKKQIAPGQFEGNSVTVQ